MSTKEKAKTLEALGDLYEDLKGLEEERKAIAARIRGKKREINEVLASIHKRDQEDNEN